MWRMRTRTKLGDTSADRQPGGASPSGLAYRSLLPGQIVSSAVVTPQRQERRTAPDNHRSAIGCSSRVATAGGRASRRMITDLAVWSLAAGREASGGHSKTLGCQFSESDDSPTVPMPVRSQIVEDPVALGMIWRCLIQSARLAIPPAHVQALVRPSLSSGSLRLIGVRSLGTDGGCHEDSYRR